MRYLVVAALVAACGYNKPAPVGSADAHGAGDGLVGGDGAGTWAPSNARLALSPVASSPLELLRSCKSPPRRLRSSYAQNTRRKAGPRSR